MAWLHNPCKEVSHSERKMRGRSSFLFFSRAVMPAQTFQVRRFELLYMAELATGQDESNPVF